MDLSSVYINEIDFIVTINDYSYSHQILLLEIFQLL